MSISIRPGTAADLPTVRDIAYATWPETFRDILAPAQITYMLEWLYALPRLQQQVRSGEHVLHLAEMDAKCIGFVAHQINFPETGVTKIHKLYLLPEAQGKGVGRALVEAVSDVARQYQQAAVILNINKHNNAVAFYEAIGFDRAGEEVIDIGNGYVMDDYVMRLPL